MEQSAHLEGIKKPKIILKSEAFDLLWINVIKRRACFNW